MNTYRESCEGADVASVRTCSWTIGAYSRYVLSIGREDGSVRGHQTEVLNCGNSLIYCTRRRVLPRRIQNFIRKMSLWLSSTDQISICFECRLT
jgi:hypothetical protein